MYALIILLCITSICAQESVCSCSCCGTTGCTPVPVGTINLLSCTISTCAERCRTTFPECRPFNAQVQVSSQCSTTMAPLFNCQCNCCRTGSTSCTPVLVGYSTAYSCQDGSCSISCARQYPAVCVADQNGQTQGSCTGLVTTTTTSTTTSTTTTNLAGSWLTQTCSCQCCQSGLDCVPNLEVGIASSAQCSSSACTEACQNRYTSACPSLSYLGQTNGTCTSAGGGSARCRCRCCDTNICRDYEPSFNGNCASCQTRCQQIAPCTNLTTVTQTCTSNRSNQSVEANYLYTVFLFAMSLLLFR